MRGVDILLAVPALIVALAVIAVLGPGVLNITLAIGLRSIPIYARIVRAEVIGLTARDFIQERPGAGRPARAHPLAAPPAEPGRLGRRHLRPAHGDRHPDRRVAHVPPGSACRPARRSGAP